MAKIVLDKKYSKNYFDNIISENEESIKKLNSDLNEKNFIISKTKSHLFDLEFDLNNLKNKISNLEADLAKKEIENNSKDNKIQDFNSQIQNNKIEINTLRNQVSYLENELNKKNKEFNIQNEAFNFMEKKYAQQSSKLDSKRYCISCYEEKMGCDALEIEYLKKNVLIRKFFNPLTYLYLVFKSKTNEISINFKLYKALKNSKCFDVGYYLNNNKDLVESKWCKYFSPELHYVCKGFDEERKFNKKYFNRNSKKELLDYISKCI